jgi:rubrerythrin
MYIFNAHDAIEFAIRVEENGERFYREAARLVDDQGVKDLFSGLADDEVGHRKRFEEMRGALGDYSPPETYEGEYMAYLRDYIDEKAVFRKELKEDYLRGGGDTLRAIAFALQRELDSISYYQEMKRYVPEIEHPLIDRIVGEERSHFKRLSELRKGMAG